MATPHLDCVIDEESVGLLHDRLQFIVHPGRLPTADILLIRLSRACAFLQRWSRPRFRPAGHLQTAAASRRGTKNNSVGFSSYRGLVRPPHALPQLPYLKLQHPVGGGQAVAAGVQGGVVRGKVFHLTLTSVICVSIYPTQNFTLAASISSLSSSPAGLTWPPTSPVCPACFNWSISSLNPRFSTRCSLLVKSAAIQNFTSLTFPPKQ